MKPVTIDMNCVIDLEEDRPAAVHVRELVRIHASGKVRLRVPGIAASERKPGGTYAANFQKFVNKISAVGLVDVEILKPMCYLDVAYYDWCILPDDTMIDFERRIHEVLFPNIEFLYRDFCTRYAVDPNVSPGDPRWRNPKCDVQAVWSHIHNGDGIFVTSDRNFHNLRKKHALITLGAGQIFNPEEAVRRLSV